MYLKGNGVKKDEKLAIKYLKISVKKGDPKSIFKLAKYSEKQGNTKRAKKLYYKASVNGNSNAMNSLGLIYKKEKNFQIASELFEKASQNGNTNALNNLANLYRKGDGFEKNLNTAMELFKKAVEKKNHFAMANLGLMFEKGEKPDFDLAAHYYLMSMDNGNKNVKTRLVDLINYKTISWLPSYHIHWSSCNIMEKKNALARLFSKPKQFTLNDQILIILLVSKNRNSSRYDSVCFLVRGIALHIIKFVCEARKSFLKKL